MLAETVVDGDRCLILENPEVRIAVNVDFGAHLYELTDRRSGVNLLYEDPNGSRGYHVGGWYELFPNAGAACALDGRELSKHGDIQRQPWCYQIRVSTSESVEIDLVADSDELPFRVQKTVRFTAAVPGVDVREKITNISDHTWPYLWGQHISFGERFMTSARIHLPDVEVYAADADRGNTAYAPGARGRLHALPGRSGALVDASTLPEKGSSMMLFSEPMSEHSYQVWSADLGVGLTVAWDGQAYPVMWVWGTNHASVRPDVVACALEPQSCEVPTLAAAVEAGRAPILAAGASRSAWVTATLRYEQHPHWAQRLQQVGYRTGYFGKWHVEDTEQPSRFGWDTDGSLHSGWFKEAARRDTDGADDAGLSEPVRYNDRPAGHRKSLHYGVSEEPVERRSLGVVCGLAEQWLGEALTGEDPWCAVVSVTEPHDPFVAGAEAFAAYDVDGIELPASVDDDLAGRPALYRKAARIWAGMSHREHREAAACYCASITEIDALFGSLIAQVEAAGQRENTIVVLTSDHGELLGAHGLYTKSIMAAEEVYRVPMVVAGPGVAPGAVSAARVGLHDLAPTLVELAGAEGMDGVDGRRLPT